MIFKDDSGDMIISLDKAKRVQILKDDGCILFNSTAKISMHDFELVLNTILKTESWQKLIIEVIN